MKTVTIGRGEGCTITIDDEMMSRRHAIIKIPTFGGMEIVDMSKNGTSVNGVRLRPNIPFPVTRKDVVNFADVRQLDWSKVPDPLKYYKIGALVVGALVVLLIVISLLVKVFSSEPEQPAPAVQKTETVKPVESEKPQEQPMDQQEEAAPEETAPEATSPSAPEGAAVDQQDKVIDVYGAARASKKKREAEERARQQKAKEQKAREQKAKEQQKAPSNDKQPAGNNKNKTVVI